MLQYDNANLRDIERGSIFEFLESQGGLFYDSDVLDLGCGRQPYRRLVEAHGGRYTPFDRIDLPATCASTDVGPDEPLSQGWDVILCTQVIQYVPNLSGWLDSIWYGLRPGGRLVMTGPTNWPEVEPEDLWRFTQHGIKRLLDPHFARVSVYHRESIQVNDIILSLGWGAVAWR